MNEVDRATIVAAHRYLVWRAVNLIWPRVMGMIDKAELVSLGDLGLAEAGQRWSPDGGATFATYAWYRIQGSILDGLRATGRIPRRTWARLAALRAASELLEARAAQDAAARARGAAAESTAARLEAVRDAIASVEAAYVVSAVALDDVEERIEDPSEPPDAAVDRRAWRRRITDAIAGLPERERVLVEKHYFEGKDLAAAGAEMGISRSWASRIHTTAMDRLRKRLAAQPP